MIKGNIDQNIPARTRCFNISNCSCGSIDGKLHIEIGSLPKPLCFGRLMFI